ASARAHAWMLAPAGVVGTASLAFAGTTPTGRKLWDRWILRVPVLGDLLAKAAVARTIRTLGTLVASGVAILDALDVAARTAGNGGIAGAFSRRRTRLGRARS